MGRFSPGSHSYRRCLFKDLRPGEVFVLERRGRGGETPSFRKLTADTAAPLPSGAPVPILPDKIIFKQNEAANYAYSRCTFRDLKEGDFFVLERRSRSGIAPIYQKVSPVAALSLPDGPEMPLPPEKILFKQTELPSPSRSR
jgi:hypothetical protein